MESFLVIIIDECTCRMALNLDEDTATTLMAVASDDPSRWDDMCLLWSRYRTPPVPADAGDLPFRPVAYETARSAMEHHDGWAVIDLTQKRVVTGPAFCEIIRDQAYILGDESDPQRYPVNIHLPPWWEFQAGCDVERVDAAREEPLVIPTVNRDVLFGEALLHDLAGRILDAIASPSWAATNASGNANARYRFTVQVHRDWLLTERKDLGGRMPRQLLHGAHQWLDRLVWAQQLRLQEDCEIVALPRDVTGYETAPVGSQEMILYFDLCRELIEAGWFWCSQQASQPTSSARRCKPELVSFLAEVKQQWLQSSEDGEPAPQVGLEYSRRRVPQVAGVSIVGMDDVLPAAHVTDCDCPVCGMMAEGSLGLSIMELDGYHLELDDEFAFSMHETREAWEEHQREMAAFADGEL